MQLETKRPIDRVEWWWFLAAVIAFSIARLPLLFHTSGQMDEQWFAVPGLTVAEEGIPRIPYCPTRRRETFFENADRCLFALPPALHYMQAPFFMFMKPGYPTARMPVFLSGIVGLGLLWLFARQFIRESWIVGISLVMFAVSRPLLFTAITARPDLPCAVFGWGAMITMLCWSQRGGKRWLVFSGGLCGLGLLCHPYALVFCLQAGLWSLLKPASLIQRFVHACVLTLSAIATLGLWLPLILAYPYEFQSQFYSNVMERSGSGVTTRMLWPWESFLQHLIQQWDFNGPFQFIFLVGGLVVGTWLTLKNPEHAHRKPYVYILWAAVYFTATAAGVHPTKGYWIYALGLLYPFAVLSYVQSMLQLWTAWDRSKKSAKLNELERPSSVSLSPSIGRRLVVMATLLAIMLPLSGARTSLCYLTHWGDSRYHAGNFIAKALETLPREGLFMSDVSFIFDIYLSGRDTILCQPKTRFWGDDDVGFQYLLVGQEGLDYAWPEEYNTQFLRMEGRQLTDFDCFVEIYVPKDPKTSAAVSKQPSSIKE